VNLHKCWTLVNHFDNRHPNVLLISIQYKFRLSKPQSTYIDTLYRVSQEEHAKLREGVPYVKLYRYNPKHLYPKLNGYGDNGH